MGQHGKINKLQLGQHGLHEIAIYGATCSFVRSFTEGMRDKCPEMAMMYVDESHDSEIQPGLETWTKQGDGARLSHNSPVNALRQTMLRQAGLVVVNGNHFSAKNQIILYHPEKEAGMQKRKSQLTSVLGFVGPRADYNRLLAEGFDFTQCTHFESIDDENFVQWWRNLIPVPIIRPLVLTGGRSTRMGQDKSLMEFNGKPQYRRVYELFDTLRLTPYLSCRTEQASHYQWPQEHIITDRVLDIGPLAALISAWMYDPESALLTVACDMPHLGHESIQHLLDERRLDAIATTLCVDSDGQPEPMATIWEPRAYPIIMQAISAGTTCPRRILMNHNTHRVISKNPEQLTNVNTPEEWKQL
jgi:molybdenum cofactor guanylyltransferase